MTTDPYTSSQSASNHKTNDTSNVTEVTSAIDTTAPSTSTSEVSSVLSAEEAGQSNVGDDTFASTVGATTVNVSGHLEKGLTDRTLLAGVVILAAALVLITMYKGRATARADDQRDYYV